ncbi:MAG: isoprenylcysteine carboxylmethyltransferase family protein [Acidiferrobacterales bacterium]
MSKYPLLIMFVLLILSALLGWVYPVPSGLGPTGFLTGVVVLVAGVLLVLVAAGVFRRRGTPLDPTKPPDKLVTDGLYRISRNPMYLGMLLVLSGFPLITDSMLGFVFALGFYLFMDRKLIPREENMVERIFSEEFREYKQNTRRWI